ncbi:putative ribonuclease H-like domain-containing protein, partial [Tanacetum coccineum]
DRLQVVVLFTLASMDFHELELTGDLLSIGIRNPVTKPLFMLHMDLFGPTFMSILMHKKYCLVVTDDYSRFTWVFFLTTKDETSEIFKRFIKEIENLVDKKVKIIRSDNGTEFKNKVMDDFCSVGYELFRGFKPALSFMRPFGCHVTILNTLDSLGKFDGKSDEGFFVGYSLSSKAFRVYNTRTKRVEENLHIGFFGPKWLFDIDSLTQSMNYVPVSAGTVSNVSAGTSEENSQECIVMPIWKDTSYFDSPTENVDNGEPKTADDAQKQDEDGLNNKNAEQERFLDDSSSKDVRKQVNTVSPMLILVVLNLMLLVHQLVLLVQMKKTSMKKNQKLIWGTLQIPICFHPLPIQEFIKIIQLTM